MTEDIQRQPSADDMRFKDLQYGQIIAFIDTKDLRLTFSRENPAEAQKLIDTKQKHTWAASTIANVNELYGSKCIRCNKDLHIYWLHISSDGFAGIADAYWICTDSQCGLHRKMNFEGYGSY